MLLHAWNMIYKQNDTHRNANIFGFYESKLKKKMGCKGGQLRIFWFFIEAFAQI